mgnify:CR=1 FL=1|jgi:hypothetical protein
MTYRSDDIPLSEVLAPYDWSGEQYGDLGEQYGDLGEPVSAIIGAAAAIVAAAFAAATGVAKLIAELSKIERSQIREARARGASPEQIGQLKRYFKAKKKEARALGPKRIKQLKKLRRQMRAAGAKRREIVQAVKKQRRRWRKEATMQQQADPAEVMRQIASGLATAGDVSQRIGMGIQETQTGVALDPFTGAPVIHRGGMMPILPTAPNAPPLPGFTWLRTPIAPWAPVPRWIGLGALAGGLVYMAARRR